MGDLIDSVSRERKKKKERGSDLKPLLANPKFGCQNQNSLLVKRQNDNTSPLTRDWPRKISLIVRYLHTNKSTEPMYRSREWD